MPVPQQLPQIAILPARYPDLRKIIFQHQPQYQLRILAIRLLLAHPLRPDRGRIPGPQLKLQLRQQPFKPARVSARLHPQAHFHALSSKIAVELLRLLAVPQSPLLQFPSLGIYKSDLFEARVIIASYNDHCSAPLSPSALGWLVATKVYSGPGADIAMEF